MLASFTDALAVLFLLASGKNPDLDSNANANGIKQQASTEPPTPDAPQLSTTCGEIIDSVNEGNRVFFAEDVYSCLTSVPFDNAVAQRFISYYNESLQFHSTLAYVKNPPEGYQQAPSDVMQGLEAIKRKSASGGFANQYEFEAELQLLVYSFHDAHVDLYAGVLSAFSFGSPYNLVSVSEDGQSLPKVYFADEVLARIENGTDISAISSINGEPAVDYLSRFAALNSVGMVEAHADWNQIMHTPVQEIHGEFNILGGGGTFYPGDELNFTRENGESVDTFWLAVYNNPDYTGPLSTGADFFNYFVLGRLPASYNESVLPDSFNVSGLDIGIIDSTDTESSWHDVTFGAYPSDPAVVQEGLDVAGGGVVTGYIMDDISTGVLSLPSFDGYGLGVTEYTAAIDHFIQDAKAKDISKVIIDLQQNYGGTAQLAFVTFRQFFPRINPFAGSRRRSHAHADVLGSTITAWWEGLSLDNEDEEFDKRASAAEEWVVTDRINAETGANFTSWKEYFGPKEHNGDQFSLTERYDLSNRIFDAAAFDGWIPTQYTDERDLDRVEPWSAKDVVILTDGTCSSTCSIFLEMMTQEAGVRSIVVGGRPKLGPMQAASGSRGALLYSAESVDEDFEFAKSLDEDVASRLPVVRDPGMFVFHASLNLRDQVRPKESTPLQFQYLAADCRLYWTLDNVYNMTRLWHDVSAAAFQDDFLCVPGSTGFARTGAKPSSKPLPSSPAAPEVPPDVTDVSFEGDPDPESDNGLQAAQAPAPRIARVTPCDPLLKNPCSVGSCQPIKFRCGNGAIKQNYACVTTCQNRDGACPSERLTCRYAKTPVAESKANSLSSGKVRAGGAAVGGKLRLGFCVPTLGTRELGCPV